MDRAICHTPAAAKAPFSRPTFLLAACALGFFSMMAICSPAFTFAGEENLAEMQKQLNKEVMEKPFSVEDAARIEAYITEGMAKDLTPDSIAPSYWRAGYTCDDILRHHYNYTDYRNCRYYHRYHGSYWP